MVCKLKLKEIIYRNNIYRNNSTSKYANHECFNKCFNHWCLTNKANEKIKYGVRFTFVSALYGTKIYLFSDVSEKTEL